MEEKSNDTFKSFWYGSELSARERLCLTSFVGQGKKFELYTYDESLSVPDGVILKDASEIYPKDEVFAYRSGPGEGSVAVFANFFRYKLLYERGGWWVDMDVIYTGSDIPESGIFFARQNRCKIGMSVINLEEKKEIIRKCKENASLIGKEKASEEWGKTGPKLFTQVLSEEGLAGEARSRRYAYPIPWEEAHSSYLPEKRSDIQKKVEGYPFFHLWNEILGRMGVQKSVRPPEGSYLDEKAEELGFDWPCPEIQYSAETIRQLAKNWQESRENRHLRHLQSTLTWRIVSRLHPMLKRVQSAFDI